MMKKTYIILLSLTLVLVASAQNGDVDIAGRELNAILTTVPFLTIAPDSRSGAMGDAGVATSPDLSSQHWNPAKYAFMEDKFGIGISYTPWLQSLQVKDLNLLYLSGYYKFDEMQTASFGLRYFNLGTIDYRGPNGEDNGTGKPYEFALDVGGSRLFSEYLSMGMLFRFIYSDIAGGGRSLLNNIDYVPGMTWGADISLYYQRPIQISDYEAEMAYGLNISNIGAKMSYSDGDTKEFIPTNLRIGGRLTIDLDEYNSLAVTLDLNKLLVPTRPEYDTDGNLIAGKPNDVSTLPGMIQSFYDAPGYLNTDGSRSVGKEEWNEVMISGGLEYWYREQFAARAGYFYEHESKGNRKFVTAGVGLELNVFTLDFSYLVSIGRSSPLDKTKRFTLGFVF